MKRWPLIRHLRFWWLSYMLNRWVRMWAQRGIGVGDVNPSDLRWLQDIWEGKA